MLTASQHVPTGQKECCCALLSLFNILSSNYFYLLMLIPRFCDPNNNRKDTILFCQFASFSPVPHLHDCYTSENVNFA